MVTFQDFEEKISTVGMQEAILNTVSSWQNGTIYKTAKIADRYDRQKNDTIMNYVKCIFSITGSKMEDFTASNNKITSNFFHRLNTQRNTYLLGNGVTFADDPDGEVKDQFGDDFDVKLFKSAYKSLIHGVSFPFWNGSINCFEVTEFCPLWDEESGVLRAGIRFWQIDEKKPMFFVLYEKDGYTKYKKDKNGFAEVEPKRSYIEQIYITNVDGVEIVDEQNYSDLPIIPLYANSLKQSTLVGLRSQIDSYDLIKSGFANDLTDVAEIYWIVENFGGMTDKDLAKFRDKLKTTHIATADASEGGKITPYSSDIPFQARQSYLDSVEKSIYRDFGAFDVHDVQAGSTNDHLEAAYQPLDEEADDMEMQMIDFIQSLGALIGLDRNQCIPIFKRNKISNVTETIQALATADWLDTETKIRKTPIITVDEVEEVLARSSAESLDRFGFTGETNNVGGATGEGNGAE